MSSVHWSHDFKVGDTVYFQADIGVVMEGEIISIYGPWFWITDGAGMHTIHYYDCFESPEDVEVKAEDLW